MAEVRIPTNQIPADILQRLQAILDGRSSPLGRVAGRDWCWYSAAGSSDISLLADPPSSTMTLLADPPSPTRPMRSAQPTSSWRSATQSSEVMSTPRPESAMLASASHNDEVDGALRDFKISAASPNRKVKDVLDDSGIVRLFPLAEDVKTVDGAANLDQTDSEIVRIFPQMDKFQSLVPESTIVRALSPNPSRTGRALSPNPSRTGRALSPNPSRTVQSLSPNPSRTVQSLSPNPSRTGVNVSRPRSAGVFGKHIQKVAASIHDGYLKPSTDWPLPSSLGICSHGPAHQICDTSSRRPIRSSRNLLHSTDPQSSPGKNEVSFSRPRSSSNSPCLQPPGNEHDSELGQHPPPSFLARALRSPGRLTSTQSPDDVDPDVDDADPDVDDVDPDVDDDDVFTYTVPEHQEYFRFRPLFSQAYRESTESTPRRKSENWCRSSELRHHLTRVLSPSGVGHLVSGTSFGDRHKTRKRLSFDDHVVKQSLAARPHHHSDPAPRPPSPTHRAPLGGSLLGAARRSTPVHVCHHDHPFGEGHQPFGEGHQPFGEGHQPFGEGHQPFGEGHQPFGEGHQPFGEGHQPFGEGHQPFGEGHQPFGEGHQPFGEGNQPFGEGHQPFREGHQPFGEGHQPFGEGHQSTAKARQSTSTTTSYVHNLSQSPALDLFQSPAHNLSQSQAHNLSHSPAQKLSQSSAHNLSQSPAHNKSQSPAHNVSQSPAHNLSQSPARILPQSSAHNLSQSPAHNLSQSPAHNKSQSPAHNVSQSQAHNLSQSPAHNVSQSLPHNFSQNHNLSQSQAHNLSQSPAHNVSQSPAHNLSQSPARILSQSQAHNVFQSPAHNLSQSPAQNTLTCFETVPAHKRPVQHRRSRLHSEGDFRDVSSAEREALPRSHTFSHSKRRRTDCPDGEEPAPETTGQLHLAWSGDQGSPAAVECACSKIAQNFLQLVEGAYRRVGQVGGAQMGFDHFRHELALTNDILRESLVIVQQFRFMCRHEDMPSVESSLSVSQR